MSNGPSQSDVSDVSNEQEPESSLVNHPVSSPVSQNQSSVEVREMIGTLFLGILSLILTFTLLRTLTRNRKLEVQLARLEKGNSPA
jgi:hypothetical protein